MPTEVSALARNVVRAVDPDALRYFDADAQAYFERGFPRDRGDTPLGSGLESALVALTPVALYVAQKVADHVLDEAIEQGRRKIARSWPRRRNRDSALRDLKPLDDQQAERIRRLVVEAATRRGVEADVATGMADAVLAHLPRHDA
ncbi:hypothetical protein [Actinoplanes sp. NPDC049265]|uniref:hypothetical protein n=1 Tax=Actinoplanes sp. NPDC049265 TaxID=3363902 RepID=UPI00371AEA71